MVSSGYGEAREHLVMGVETQPRATTWHGVERDVGADDEGAAAGRRGKEEDELRKKYADLIVFK